MKILLAKPLGREIRVSQAKHREKALTETSVEILKENIVL